MGKCHFPMEWGECWWGNCQWGKRCSIDGLSLEPTCCQLQQIKNMFCQCFRCQKHKQSAVSILRLPVPFCRLLGKIKHQRNILFYKTAVFTFKMANHYGNHKCHEEKNVPIALILPSIWQDSAESLGIETTSCLCE